MRAVLRRTTAGMISETRDSQEHTKTVKLQLLKEISIAIHNETRHLIQWGFVVLFVGSQAEAG